MTVTELVRKIIDNQVEAPPDFNKIFQDNFLNLLAKNEELKNDSSRVD